MPYSSILFAILLRVALSILAAGADISRDTHSLDATTLAAAAPSVVISGNGDLFASFSDPF